MKVIDLFSGCGGFSVGFKKQGFEIIKAVEFDQSIAESYKKNHKNTIVYNNDISEVDNTEHFKKGEADVIIGGPPCQGFSAAGLRNRTGFIDDERNYLFRHYVNIVKIVQPKIFIMENVKGLLTMQGGKVYKEITKSFKNKELFFGNEYNIYTKVLDAADYGVPQRRQRVFIIGVKNTFVDLDYEWSMAIEELKGVNKHFFKDYSVWDAISNLPKPTIDGNIYNCKPTNTLQIELQSEKEIIENHKIGNHTKKSVERMKQIGIGENYKVLNEVIKSVHSGSYGRLDPSLAATTITTRFDTPSGGRFIHPFENRTLTAREAARIQTFPDDFIFYGSKTSITTQIGNAVPPKLSEFLSVLVRRLLNDNFTTR